MSESEGVAKKAATGIEAILQRIADFFDIFDLSFLLSGAVVLAAIRFWFWRIDFYYPPMFHGWAHYAALIIAAYVAGLICFSLGRFIRERWRNRKHETEERNAFLHILRAHGLDALPVCVEYLARNGNVTDSLYVRLWAEVRDCAEIADSHALLRRYWVMAATLDGMLVALIVWIMAIAGCQFGVDNARPIDRATGWAAIVGLGVAAWACRREAGRYAFYQMTELVATIAAKRGRSGS